MFGMIPSMMPVLVVQYLGKYPVIIKVVRASLFRASVGGIVAVVGPAANFNQNSMVVFEKKRRVERRELLRLHVISELHVIPDIRTRRSSPYTS